MSDAAPALASYAFTPRPHGREIRFMLREDALEVDDQRRVTRIPLAEIEEARLTFEPRGSAMRGFGAKFVSRGRRSTSFTNLSWRSLIQVDHQNEAYRAFLAALLPAIGRANPNCRFAAGRPAPIWALFVIASGVMLLGVGYAAAMAAPRIGTLAGVVTIGFALAFAWLAIEMVGRNRPRLFAPDAPPRNVLP